MFKRFCFKFSKKVDILSVDLILTLVDIYVCPRARCGTILLFKNYNKFLVFLIQTTKVYYFHFTALLQILIISTSLRFKSLFTDRHECGNVKTPNFKFLQVNAKYAF